MQAYPACPIPTKKGLTFISSPYHHTPWQKEQNHKDLFRELDNLKEKYVDKYAQHIPVRANRLLKCSLIAIKFNFNKLTVGCPKPNLTYGERCALRNLHGNNQIVISKPDKGDTTVIMATLQYLELAY